MAGMILILIFTALLAMPVFYIITRRVFPRVRKKTALYISILLTVLLVFVLLIIMMGAA